MCSVTIDVPEEVLLDLHEDRGALKKYIQEMLALDLYTHKKVSLGYCASIAGMNKDEFIRFLGVNGVSIFGYGSEEEFLEELANA